LVAGAAETEPCPICFAHGPCPSPRVPVYRSDHLPGISRTVAFYNRCMGDCVDPG
jgi:hypothetical protein